MSKETLITDDSTPEAGSPNGEAPDGVANAPEGKTAEPAAVDVAPANSALPEAPEQPEGAPEKYDFADIEGVNVDPSVIVAFSDVAKELDLSQDKAQAVLNKMAPVIAARQTEQLQAASDEWANSSRLDKEFGGDKLNENLGIAKKALEEFASPELKTLLDQSGLGNHPEIIRLLYRAGKAISDDSFVSGRKATSEKGDARALYAASNMNP